MKGIVFTEFIEMVEDTFSMTTANKIVDESDLPSGGVYTSIGTYDVSEMITLVTVLSQETKIPSPKLIQAFGHHLFQRFHEKFPHFFMDIDDCFDFLINVEDYIHIEVRKLYPDAALPKFDCEVADDRSSMLMTYRSPRCLSDLADGLIRGCIEHYDEPITVTREVVEPDGSVVRFVLTRAA